jgi:hypothetical protein
MQWMRSAYKVYAGKLKGKRTFGRPRCRLRNIKTKNVLQEVM